MRLLIAVIRNSLHALTATGPCCRFTPTCSQYMTSAIDTHGFFRGLGLGLCRIIRCLPGGAWGHDPVPTTPPSRNRIIFEGGPRGR